MRASVLFAIAARYSLGGRRATLSSFLSMLSVLGMVLAIALLILVLSVMNGFDREMRENILSLVPQLTLNAWRPVADWQAPMEQLVDEPGVEAVAPFVELQGMLLRDVAIETALIQGVDPDLQRRLSGLERVVQQDHLARFAADTNGMLLGARLVERLGVDVGDSVTLIVPAQSGQTTPQFAVFTLSGAIRSDTELDESLAVVQLQKAISLSGGGVHGFRVRLTDVFAAPQMGWRLIQGLPPGFYASDWTQTHGNLYSAIQMSRDLVILLLVSIIAIAAFNVVSSLVLVVLDKRADIAILRALGARPEHIRGIFLRQGLFIALVGTTLGTALGVLASLGATDAVALIEQWLGIRFLDTDVYPIGYLPTDLRLLDLLVINGVAIILCFVAALYPARRAARLPPAEALRHD